MSIAKAIEESILRDRIVTLDHATPDDIDALTSGSEDWVENGTVIEFWGTDDDGNKWRVHVEARR